MTENYCAHGVLKIRVRSEIYSQRFRANIVHPTGTSTREEPDRGGKGDGNFIFRTNLLTRRHNAAAGSLRFPFLPHGSAARLETGLFSPLARYRVQCGSIKRLGRALYDPGEGVDS